MGENLDIKLSKMRVFEIGNVVVGLCETESEFILKNIEREHAEKQISHFLCEFFEFYPAFENTFNDLLFPFLLIFSIVSLTE